MDQWVNITQQGVHKLMNMLKGMFFNLLGTKLKKYVSLKQLIPMELYIHRLLNAFIFIPELFYLSLQMHEKETQTLTGKCNNCSQISVSCILSLILFKTFFCQLLSFS